MFTLGFILQALAAILFFTTLLLFSLDTVHALAKQETDPTKLLATPGNGKVKVPDYHRAMSRIRARLTQTRDIEVLATFRGRTKFLREITDKDLLREAHILLARFTEIANAYGDACLAARNLETQARTDQRTAALTSEVLAATALVSDELASIIARQGGLPADRRMSVLSRFISQRYGNGPVQLTAQ